MDAATLSLLHDVFQDARQKQDWKIALDALFVSLRGSFVFDNVAIYLEDPQTQKIEVAYARAVGRGKAAEADAAWGQDVAVEAFSQNQIVMKAPTAEEEAEQDRLRLAHLLGFPLSVGAKLSGALAFIRFGGPAYAEQHIQIAALHALWVASFIERKELQAARVELNSVQRQMRLQDDFVSTISHELRTPLGFIKGYSTSLLRQDTVWDAETQREFLTIIDEESDRLTKLIDDMLEASRLHSKTLLFKFSPVRVDALARDVAARITTYRPELKVVFDVQPLPPVYGDGARLSQVFENLFSNAIKYAPHSALTVSMRVVAENILVAVADKGEGVSAEYLPFLFERFYRVPRESAVTGTGLGLYICKQIIMAHHGNIWAESTLKVGTTFFIELPIESKPT